MKKNLLLLLTVLFSLCTTNAWAATETYVKVTSAPSDWSGEYLIVYESGTVAFNGNLTTLDATSNTTSVAISNSKISLDPKYSFTIAKSDDNYTIKSASGYYIGQTSNANGLASQNTTSYANTISINDNGTVNLVSGGAYLRYNATSGQTRFRYFKSSTYTGQKAICLYKKAADVTTYTVTYDLNGGTGTTPTQANVAAGGTFTLAASSGFSRTGYSFAGWNDGTTTYNAGATYTMPAKAVTLKAQWTVLSSATITLSEAGVTTSVTGKYVGDSYTLPSTTSQSCGDKTFVGWSTVQVAETDAKPTSNYYELGEQVTLAASQTFYAVFATKETSGSGTAGWNKVTSTSDLEAGATYAISNAATAGTYLSTWDGGNNFDGSTSTICPLILGGSESAWTFQIADGSTYNNYFLTATNTTEKNYLKAVENADNYSNFTISFTDGAAVITCTEKNSRNILRYNANNGSPIFACYSSGQSAVYLQKYSTGTPTTYSDYTTQCSTETADCLLLNFVTNIANNYTASFAQNTTATALTVSAQYNSSATGVTYQWYSNTSNSTTGGTAITDATSASYTPATTTVGTKYYYCVATYDECTITSNVATVTITEPVTTFTVIFNSDGGSSVATQTIEENQKATEPTAPTKAGYEFAGWYNGDTEFDFNTTITGDITLTAKWNIITYNITYEGLEGATHSNPSTYTVETETITFTNPSDREGYVFKGWTPASIAKGSTGDKTVTATWAKTYTIIWKVGGVDYNTGSPTTQVESGNKITAVPTAPADDAIGDCADTFMGWSESNLGSAEGQSAPTDLFTTLAEAQELTITENKTFYAVFATAEETGGGTVEATLSFASTEQRTSVSTLQQVWTQNGITFTHDKADGDDIKDNYAPIRCYKNSKITIAHTSNTITKIVFDCNSNDYATALKNSIGSISGTVSSSSDKVTVAFTNAVTSFTVTLSSGQVRLDALTVTAGGGTITTYSNYVTNCCALAPATNLTVSGTTAISATLTWTAPSPTTGITKLQVRNAETDAIVVDNIAVNTTTATITGLTECTSYQYYVVSVGDCEVVSNTVTATPFSGAKTVNYDYNGGSGSPASFTTNCINQTITLPVAIRDGYTFKGWYTAATGGTRVGDANDTYEPATTPVTLYAQWTINQYTVTWNPNGGNWNGSTVNIVQTYEYGAAINKPDDPTRENGIFKGWSPEPTSTMLASNKTYTAQWEMVYTLTFVDMNTGGTTRTQTQQSSGESIVAPTADSEVCDMWTFIGWAPSNSLNGGTDKPTGFIDAGETIPGSQITENKTYYSVYSYNSDGTPPFSIGKSGTYYMYALDGSTKYYATTNRYGSALNAGHETTNDFTTYPKAKVKLAYNSNTNKYKIQITTFGSNPTDGYLYHPDKTENDLTHNSFDNYTEFALQQGNALGFNIVYAYTVQQLQGSVYVPVEKTGCFGRSSSHFQGSSTITDVYFEPASEIQYYNAANCGEVETYTMSFHNPFGDENALIWYDAEHEDSYYTDKPFNTLIDVFPTMVYNGWAFIGWTANQQYNELIGEDNLDDENSATNDPASLFTIYSNTAGWAYTLKSNVTMYPVFTKFEDNEPFDMVNGGDYYIYYIADGDIETSEDEYGAANRIYAGGWESGGTNESYGATQSCAEATLFTFTKLSNGKWTIYDNNKGKYLCADATDNNLALNATTATNGEWTITVHNGNQVNAVSKDGYTLSAQSQDATTGTFKNYKSLNFDNANSQYYHRVYLGTCTERVYSSNPTNKPAITLSGEPIVTSTQDQSIRAQGELSISATKLAANGTITLTSDNADIYFSSVKDANFTQAAKPVTPLTLNADENGKLAMTTVYVHYKPTSTSSLGVQTATITATSGTEGEDDHATAETTAQVRNLSAKFVIATKVGATWYALPADMNTASNPLGVVIEVDETNMTATAPNSCTYTLFPVKTTNTEYDRYEEYGDRLRFSAVNNSYKGLWANNSKTDLTINNDMVIDQASDGQTGSDLANNSYYEWKVTTTVVDGHWQYTLQTDQTQNQNYLRYWTSAEGTPVGPKWGTYNAGENKLYFLPVTETQPFEYAVVEWYPTKMLIQTDAAIASPTVKIRGEEVATPVLTSKGGKLYEISNLPLETNPNEVLQVSFSADAINYVNAKVVPIILSRGEKSITGEPFATLTQKVYQYADVVVRDGATLTIDGGTDVANTLLGVTIYPTAKVSIADDKKLSVHNLTFFGGIDEIYDGSDYTINKYGVPQLSLKGILNKTITNMDYIMRVNLDQMYQVGVPYDVNLSDITYWDGTTMTLGDNLYVSAYDGQKRANREEKSWVWETDFTEKVLKAGIGYTISADKQDAAHEYSIIRMPMKNNITSGNTEIAKTVQVFAYDNKNGVEITDNHKGWNYLSNPYMTSISGAKSGGVDNNNIVVGYLVETGTGPWKWVNDEIRYVTIPYDDGTNYYQRKFSEATLLPFKSFFLQIANSGDLSFALASRQNAPARYLQSSNEQREVEFEVLLANDTRSDNLGFLIGEDYTPAYEINADLEKMIGSMSVYTIYNGYNLAYNALSPANAEEQIPIGYVVPTVGEYTFALDESSDIEDVEHIYLIDYETSAITDLVTDVYTFTTLEQKSDTRFAINVALKSKDNAATGLDNMNTNGELPTKFIYHDKIFILHHGVIYDATGKRVITINK